MGMSAAVTNGKQQFIGLITLVKESLPLKKKSDIHLFIYFQEYVRVIQNTMYNFPPTSK